MQAMIAPLASSTADNRELAGKVAIVTGSTSGIGLGIAQAFAAAGMNVMLNGFGPRDAIEESRSSLVRFVNGLLDAERSLSTRMRHRFIGFTERLVCLRSRVQLQAQQGRPRSRAAAAQVR